MNLAFYLELNPHELSYKRIILFPIVNYENHDIAIAMSPSCADPVLPWLCVFFIYLFLFMVDHLNDKDRRRSSLVQLCI